LHSYVGLISFSITIRLSSLVTVSAAVCGMVGAWAGKLLGNGVVLSFSVDEAGVSTITGLPGEPLGAFIAAFVGIEVGRLISGKTPLDILLTPLFTIASGSFVGIRAGHTKGHFARAVMEGVCMSMKDCMLTLDDIGIKHNVKAVAIGGGAKSEIWRQMLADSLGITLITKEHSDSSFGSAMLAGIALGVWETPEDALNVCNKTILETVPIKENTKKYQKLFEKYKKIQKALEPIYNEG